MNAPFFEKTIPREAHVGKFIFPLAAPPGIDISPRNRANTGNLSDFEIWGFFGERVERQGKVYRTAPIEYNFHHRNPHVPHFGRS